MLLNVAAIFTQVDGDAVGAGLFGTHGEGNGIGLDGAGSGLVVAAIAGLTDGRAVVDVNAEENHGARR